MSKSNIIVHVMYYIKQFIASPRRLVLKREIGCSIDIKNMWLERSKRPVLKHGPRSLIYMQVYEPKTSNA